MTISADGEISSQAFADLVAQYHHRLLSLEAELKDRARTGRMPTSQFARRVKRLKQVHLALADLQRMCVAEMPESKTQHDIGLPILSECTPDELAVVESFLEEREDDVRDLEEQSSKVYRWLSETACGQAGVLKITLRLSKLRVLIQAYEKRIAALGDEVRSMNVLCEKLFAKSAENGTSISREVGRDALEGLINLFHSLDATIQRVARLKVALKREEEKTKSVATWLKKQESLVAHQKPKVPPPSPLTTARAARKLSSQIMRAIERTKRRKDLVERFWEDVVCQGESGARTMQTAVTQGK